jgi:hypothetical protein
MELGRRYVLFLHKRGTQEKIWCFWMRFSYISSCLVLIRS